MVMVEIIFFVDDITVVKNGGKIGKQIHLLKINVTKTSLIVCLIFSLPFLLLVTFIL